MMVTVLPRQNSLSWATAGDRQAPSHSPAPAKFSRKADENSRRTSPRAYGRVIRYPIIDGTLGVSMRRRSVRLSGREPGPSRTSPGGRSSLKQRLEREAGAAAAGGGDVRVIHLKRGADQIVHEIDLRTSQISERDR